MLKLKIFSLILVVKKAVNNKWLNRITKVVKDIKCQHAKQVNSSIDSLVHFYNLTMLMIALNDQALNGSDA